MKGRTLFSQRTLSTLSRSRGPTADSLSMLLLDTLSDLFSFFRLACSASVSPINSRAGHCATAGSSSGLCSSHFVFTATSAPRECRFRSLPNGIASSRRKLCLRMDDRFKKRGHERSERSRFVQVLNCNSVRYRTTQASCTREANFRRKERFRLSLAGRHSQCLKFAEDATSAYSGLFQVEAMTCKRQGFCGLQSAATSRKRQNTRSTGFKKGEGY